MSIGFYNWILYTIQFINLFFMHNFKLQNFKFKHLIDDIAIDLLIFWKFCKHGRYKNKI